MGYDMKNIFDFNVHLPQVSKGKAGQEEYTELYDNIKDFGSLYDLYSEKLRGSIDGANFMLLNERLIFAKDIDLVMQRMRGDYKYCYVTVLIDFRHYEAREAVDRAVLSGVNGIKFHSYVQRITENDFPEVLKIAKYAEAKGLFLCIDTSYGTAGMYRYDNLRLAAFLSEFVCDVPLILLHSAGMRILEAMLLASDKRNVFLETSFSMPYYLGSSIEKDFAFAYKKIGTDRILYGSDFPYVSVKESMNLTQAFFEKYDFSEDDIDRIMMGNALSLAASTNRRVNANIVD